MKNLELKEVFPLKECLLTPEEAAMEAEWFAQMDEAYQQYAAICECYEMALQLEYDTDRQLIIEKLLEQLHEDNK